MAIGGSGPRRTTYFIEWNSAKIVREAASHFRPLRGQAREEEGEPPAVVPYVITIAGTDLKVFQGSTEEQLKAATYLRSKRDKTKVAPDVIRSRKTPAERIASVQFAFPRELEGQPVISDQEKSVEFSCKVKDVTVKTNFNVTKMVTLQGRAL